MTNEHHDDSFLHQLPESPRPEFARNLAARLQQIEPEPVHGRRWPALPRPGGRRAAIAVAAAGALVLAVFGVTMPFTDDTHTVSAEAVLERAQAAVSATNSPRTYHARATITDNRREATVTTQETWFGGNGRARVEMQTRKGSGPAVLSGFVTDGSRIWEYTTENGQTRYQIYENAGPGKDIDTKLSGGGVTSLAQLLASYNPKGSGCATAQHQGETTVAGRAAYVIAVSFSADCPGKPGQPRIARQTMAADKQTFLPLRNQTYGADGALLYSYEIQSIRYDVAIPDATFTYTPPPGAVHVPPPSKSEKDDAKGTPKPTLSASPSPSATSTR
jgi:outer membrane lipoprotein-sorting protein